MSPQSVSAPLRAQPRTCDSSPSAAGVRSPVVSWTAAGLAAGCILASSASFAPVALATAGFFLLAVASDVRRLRIPNRLCGPALLAALIGQAWLSGAAGLAAALAGAGLALLVLVPAWLVGVLGAGDVKAAAVLGALQGVTLLATALLWSALLGGVLGLALVIASGELRSLATRWLRNATLSLVLRRVVWCPPEPGSAAARVIPFAAVLALGTSAALAWGAPWA